MIDSSHDVTTPFAGETPRREAVRTMGAAGAALLGALGLSAASRAKGKKRSKKKKKKKKPCRCNLIGLTSALSEPFSVGADQGVTKKASCPAGFIAISGGLQGESEVTVPCMIRESRVEADGSAWVINVFCTEATNTQLRVGAICFSTSSFQQQG
jgi:hypothetical protein